MRHADLKVLYEDNHLLAVEKPAGLPVQPDESGDPCLIDRAKAYLIEKYNKPGDAYVGLPHRIDRPVSGLVLLTKTSKALERLVGQFRERKVEKYYLAVVKGLPNPMEGVMKGWLQKNRKLNKSFVTGSGGRKKAKWAECRYMTLGQLEGRSLVLLRLDTGRHHQLRVQLADLGTPVVGDVKYGGPKHANPHTILLHSFFLAVKHPTLKNHTELYSAPPSKGEWGLFSHFYVKNELRNRFDKFEDIE